LWTHLYVILEFIVAWKQAFLFVDLLISDYLLYIKRIDLLDLSQVLTMDRYTKIPSLGRILILFKILFKCFLKAWCKLTLQSVNDVFGGIPFSIWHILIYMLYIVSRIRALEICKNKSFENVSSTFISYCNKKSAIDN